MSYYDEYKDLLNRKYIPGDQDCFGLVREYYKNVFGVDIPNFARPEGFYLQGFDLIYSSLQELGFEVVDVPLSKVKRGDGLIFRVASSTLSNHVGVFVGNNYFIHHLWNGVSCEENFDDKWKGRVMAVVRNPLVEAQNKLPKDRIQLIDLIKPELRDRINAISNG